MTNRLQNRKDMAELAQRRADLYGRLIDILGSLPGRDLLDSIRRGEIEDLEISLSGPDNAGFSETLDRLRSYRDRIAGKPDREVLEELAVDRTGFLQPSGESTLRAPYEGLYRGRKNAGMIALDVKKVYRESGLLPDESVSEAPDFICIEMDFMRQLCLREHEQRTAGADAAVTVAAEESFLREHLGNWAGEFCSQAANSVASDFYRAFFIILAGVIRIDLAYLRGLAGYRESRSSFNKCSRGDKEGHSPS